MFTSAVLALLLTVAAQKDADRIAPPERPVFGFPTEDAFAPSAFLGSDHSVPANRGRRQFVRIVLQRRPADRHLFRRRPVRLGGGRSRRNLAHRRRRPAMALAAQRRKLHVAVGLFSLTEKSAGRRADRHSPIRTPAAECCLLPATAVKPGPAIPACFCPL